MKENKEEANMTQAQLEAKKTKKSKNMEHFEKFSTTFKNKNKVDTNQICRNIRGKE